jgi:DNA-directed RNA polymerase subunit N (RpoN/RPB10)
MTFIILSKLEKDYNDEFLIIGTILVILDSLGLIFYCCKKKHEIQEK